MLGYSVAEALRIPYMDLIHPGDQQRAQEAIRRQMVQGLPVEEFSGRFRHKDGRWRVLSWRSMPLGDLMFATARDITEKIRAQEELQEAKQQLERRVAERTQALEQANQSLGRSEQRFRALVEHGADINARQTREPSSDMEGRNSLNRFGATPLFLAAKSVDVPLMETLLELGADPFIGNVDGDSPLMVAAGVGVYSQGESPGLPEESADAVKILMQLSGRSRFEQQSIAVDLGPRSAIIYDPVRRYSLQNLSDVDQLILQVPRSTFGDDTLARLASPLSLPARTTASPASYRASCRWRSARRSGSTRPAAAGSAKASSSSSTG